MGRMIVNLLASIWPALTRIRGFRLAFILAIPVLFVGTAFTVARWSLSAGQLLQPATLPVTGQQRSNPQILSFMATATTLPFSPASPALSGNLAEPNCVQPSGWVPYMVSPTDSLHRLSVTYGVTLISLEQANCLKSTSLILPGQLIFVPDLIPGAPELPPPTATPTSVPFALILPKQYTVNLPQSNPKPLTSQPQSQPKPQPPSATAVPQPTPANTVSPVVSQPQVNKPAPADKAKTKPPKHKKPPPDKLKADHPNHKD